MSLSNLAYLDFLYDQFEYNYDFSNDPYSVYVNDDLIQDDDGYCSYTLQDSHFYD